MQKEALERIFQNQVSGGDLVKGGKKKPKAKGKGKMASLKVAKKSTATKQSSKGKGRLGGGRLGGGTLGGARASKPLNLNAKQMRELKQKSGMYSVGASGRMVLKKTL